MSPTISTQAAHAFVVVAMNEGSTLTEIAGKMGANYSTASRHLGDLGARTRKKEVGFGLIQAKINPANYTERLHTLTPRGKFLAQMMQDVMKE